MYAAIVVQVMLCAVNYCVILIVNINYHYTSFSVQYLHAVCLAFSIKVSDDYARTLRNPRTVHRVSEKKQPLILLAIS